MGGGGQSIFSITRLRLNTNISICTKDSHKVLQKTYPAPRQVPVNVLQYNIKLASTYSGKAVIQNLSTVGKHFLSLPTSQVTVMRKPFKAFGQY